MIVEIRKGGFINKGAELMLLAVLDKVSSRFPTAKFTIIPSSERGGQAYSDYSRLGIYPKASIRKFGLDVGTLLCLVPKKIRERYGVVLDSEVDVVIDIAGFAYSDQCGVAVSKDLYRSSKAWKRQGKKVIFMPQALGPFRNAEISNYVSSFLAAGTLVFARDNVSYGYTKELDGVKNLKLCPDFTCGLKGKTADRYQFLEGRPCVVPNARMIDRVDGERAGRYLDFLTQCINHLIAQGERPFVLVHERDDYDLAVSLAKRAGDIDVIYEQDALLIKGIIGTASFMIGGRYHGLVSALSQCVPALATGWSHKYEELFNDFGLDGTLILDVMLAEAELIEKLDAFTALVKQGGFADILDSGARKIEQQVDLMWKEVFDSISM
ncbi:polysaccharide pyruvyl transferase family protein [Pseudomonas turukhanskensis]|uniref:Polysaccharide pyruvyl transferase domain-containing protein n=1 Tax=Pseudomonas turukhanskensis TaxID=1806536 RepID=A0A9W6NFK6_9PSED|nr:polysaccharide pyruvyl transferase family protein [Pseudomonas turukhanskensis]GLK88932.1 hypothetical protein GCM10017655_19940 [Pseudomonas turukhanskensis]